MQAAMKNATADRTICEGRKIDVFSAGSGGTDAGLGRSTKNRSSDVGERRLARSRGWNVRKNDSNNHLVTSKKFQTKMQAASVRMKTVTITTNVLDSEGVEKVNVD